MSSRNRNIIAASELRERIQEGGWSSAALADALGLHTTTLSRYQTGASPAPRWLLLAIEGAEARGLPRRRRRTE